VRLKRLWGAADERQQLGLDVRVVRDVAVPMPDGVVLRHDRHVPAVVTHVSVVLFRSLYGRAGLVRAVVGRLVALGRRG